MGPLLMRAFGLAHVEMRREWEGSEVLSIVVADSGFYARLPADTLAWIVRSAWGSEEARHRAERVIVLVTPGPTDSLFRNAESGIVQVYIVDAAGTLRPQ